MKSETTRHYIFSNRNFAWQFNKEVLLDDWDTMDPYCTRYAIYDVQKKDVQLIPELKSEDEISKKNKAVQYTLSGNAEKLKGSQRFFFELYNDIYAEHKAGNTTQNQTLIFIFGFWVSQPKSLEFLQQMHEKYIADENSPFKRIIMYSWPSQTGNIMPETFGMLNWNQTLERTKACGNILSNFYEKLWRFGEQYVKKQDASFYKNVFLKNFSIMSQSMGNQVFGYFVKKISRYKKANLPKFQQAFMMAPDLDNDVFEPGNMLEDADRIAEKIFVFYKADDSALALSRFVFAIKDRLGKTGLRKKNKKPGIVIPVNANNVNDLQLKEKGDDHRYFITSSSKIPASIKQFAMMPDIKSLNGLTYNNSSAELEIT